MNVERKHLDVMDFKSKSAMLLQCLPEAAYRNLLASLHEGMQSRIEELERQLAEANKKIQWEQNHADRIGTHGPDCHLWGHRHYECLLRKFEEVSKVAESLCTAMILARQALQSANENQNGPISDTIWMPHGSETLFDFMDAAIVAAEMGNRKAILNSSDRWIDVNVRRPTRNEPCFFWHTPTSGLIAGYPAIADEWRDEHHLEWATHWMPIAAPEIKP